jgi:hypothetical protein
MSRNQRAETGPDPTEAMLEPTGSLVAPLRILLALPAAVLATLAMDMAMRLLPEGETITSVPASVLTEQPVAAAPPRLAATVHYVAGLLTGPLYVVLLLLVEGLLGPSALAYAVATAVLYVLMVGFFAGVVLRRPTLPDRQRAAIGRAWAGAAAAYLLVLTPLVWAGTLALAAV